MTLTGESQHNKTLAMVVFWLYHASFEQVNACVFLSSYIHV